MEEAGAVVAFVALEWTVGTLAGGAWTQSWGMVRRGHFRILAWTALSAATVAALAARSSDADPLMVAASVSVVGTIAYLVSQYAFKESLSVFVGGAGAAAGAISLALGSSALDDWPQMAAAGHLIAGAALLGGVTNGMLLGHWYLNQPGLNPRALARLTTGSLLASIAAGLLGLISAGRLLSASTEGAVLGLPGFGSSFGPAFFGIWVALVGLTGGVVWMARRCISIRSIQSATGLYYVALLTAGVAQFLVSYLIVRSA